MQNEQGAQLQYLQEKVKRFLPDCNLQTPNIFLWQIYMGELVDTELENIGTYFYDLPETSASRNRYIYPTAQTGSLRISNLHDLFARSHFQPTQAAFLYPGNLIHRRLRS